MDLHGRWTHRWRNKKTKSYHSPVHGLGLVATDNIPRGEIVFVYGGIIVPSSQIQEYWHQAGHVGIQIDNDFFIVPASREELEKEGVINHSCEPNTGLKNQVELITIKDVKAGEEITFDYAICESLMESFECRCRAQNCRKLITKDDWQSKNLQEKYGAYFSPYLKSKFEK